MRTKALIIAARPEPFEGRWIRIDNAKEWRAVPRGDYGDLVKIEVESSDGRLSKAILATDGALIRGYRARAVIMKGEFDGINIITVKLIEENHAA